MNQYDVDLRDYWRITKKRKAVIIFSVIIMSIFSFAFGKFQKSRVTDVFSSSSTIRIDRLINFQEFSPTPYRYSNIDDISTDVKTITSFNVMAEVARRVGAVSDSLSDTAIRSDPNLLVTINSLASMISPERNDLTHIITIRTVAYDPLKARDLAQSTAEAYKDYRRIELNRQLNNSIDFIRQQVTVTEDSLHAVQRQFQIFSSQNESLTRYFSEGGIGRDMVDISKKRNLISEKMSSIGAMLEILKKEGIIENAVMVSAFAEEEGVVFRQRYEDLLKTYEERQNLLRYLTSEHPQVREVNGKISSTTNFLLSQLQGNLKMLQSQRDDIDKSLEDMRLKYLESGEQKYEIQRLDTRISDLQNQYTEYMRQLQALQIKKSERIDEVTITEPAAINRIPTNPASSVRTISIIGVLIGLIIGIIFAFIFEAFDTSIGTIEDVESYLSVPVIGLIPQIEMSELKGDIAQHDRKAKDNNKLSEDHARLVIHYAPKSTLAESYRSLRTNIQFLSFEREAKVLLFTSSSPKEGKTTTIVNLALTMAQSGNRVLLVDADLRKPKVDRIFGLDRDRGLSEIILGNHPWKSCVKTVTDIITGELGLTNIILTPGIDNLHIITCGTVPPNPSELLNSESMDHFVRDVRSEYDTILFDCAPVLPATDAAVLGRKIDGVVFVYAFGKVSRSSLKRAKAQLDNVKVRVIGVVLNGIRGESTVDFHDYKYKKYYYAEDDESSSPGMVEKLRKYVGGVIGKFV